MIAMIILLALLGNTVIWAPAGHFDYTEYRSYHSVFEGEVLAKTGDSIHVWNGDRLPSSQLKAQETCSAMERRAMASSSCVDGPPRTFSP